MTQAQKNQISWYTRPKVMLQSFSFFGESEPNDTKSGDTKPGDAKPTSTPPLSTWESDGGSNFSQHPNKTKITGGERLDEKEEKKFSPIDKVKFAYHLIKGEVIKKMHPEK